MSSAAASYDSGRCAVDGCSCRCGRFPGGAVTVDPTEAVCTRCDHPHHKHDPPAAAAAAVAPWLSVDSFIANVLASNPAQGLKLKAGSAHFKKMINTIFLRFNSIMQQCDTPERAWLLYEMVKSIPQTSTKQHVQEQCGLIVSGPLSDMKPSFLTATNAKGEQLVVKLLKADLERDASQLEQCKKELAFEAQVAQQFGAKEGFLPTEVKEVQREGDTWHCLVMPRLVTTLAHSPPLPPAILLQQGQRMLTALQVMHRAEPPLVHADVKGDNIFIEQKGRWFLGDFGSCKKAGDFITSSTPGCFPHDLRGMQAQPELDLFMLGLALLRAASMQKEQYKSLFDSDAYGSSLPIRDGIEARLQQLEAAAEPQPQLARFIRELVNLDKHFA